MRIEETVTIEGKTATLVLESPDHKPPGPFSVGSNSGVVIQAQRLSFKGGSLDGASVSGLEVGRDWIGYVNDRRVSQDEFRRIAAATGARMILAALGNG